MNWYFGAFNEQIRQPTLVSRNLFHNKAVSTLVMVNKIQD